MEEVAPIVPLYAELASRVGSARVASFSVDQSVGMPALDRIALTPAGRSPST